jgi:hypothetical protein
MNSEDNVIQNQQQRERNQRQAAHRRESKAEAKARRMAAPGAQNTHHDLEAGKTPAELDGSLGVAANQEVKIEMTATEHREGLWAGYCRFALNLHRSGELPSYQDALRNGHCSDVEAPQLMNAAIEFVTERGGRRPWRLSPGPSDEQLEDLPGWIEQRLAEDHIEQEAAEYRKRWQKGLARALGKSAGQAQTGNGSRIPAWQQRSKYDLAELACRLEWTIVQHKAKRGKFERVWLDHRSSNYIRHRDGGIGTKGIIFMANAIVGRREHRDYNENWTIVIDWLREQQASRSKPEPEESAS